MGGDWKASTLGEFMRLQRGHDLTDSERRPGLVPVMGSAGQNGFHDTAKATGPGIVIGRSGASFGKVHYCKHDYWPHNTALYVTDFKGNHPRFAYYFLSSIDFSRYNSGSAQPSLNRNYIYSIPIAYPSLRDQRAIACILGALDDKIELNRKMNETLEGIARAIFKSWFVDFDPIRARSEGRDPCLPSELADLFPSSFVDSELGEIPEGWGLSVLDDLIQSKLGGDWGSAAPTQWDTVEVRCMRGADVPSLQSAGMGSMPTRFLKRSSADKRLLGDGDLVVEVSGGSPTQSTGRTVLISEEMLARFRFPLACSNFCRVVRPRAAELSLFLYMRLRWLYDRD